MSRRLMNPSAAFPRDNGSIAMSTTSDTSCRPSPCTSAHSDCSVRKSFSPYIIYRSPSCSSSTMDMSENKSSLFRSRIKRETPSPASSPWTSHLSEDDSFISRTTPGPIPSPCLSFKSDNSMGEPPVFSMRSSHTNLKKENYLSELNLNGLLKQPRFSRTPPENYAGPGDVGCDVCSGKRKKAVKSCSTCSVVYCESHVRDHYTVGALRRHVLVDVTKGLVRKTFPLLYRALEQKPLCFMEHEKGHYIPLINDGSHGMHRIQRAFEESTLEISYLRRHNEELTAKVKNLERAESELSHLTNRFCRGLTQATDFTSDFVEVAALGRPLELGMLYDCRNDSFHPDAILWEQDRISSMKLSIPRPQSDVRVLEKDSTQERLAALDLSLPLRASVVSGLVETTGASAFINHPIQSELQERVTLHYRRSTRLDMISHDLLDGGSPVSVCDWTAATHVVVAVLYGSQAFHVLDKKKTIENTQQEVEKMIASSSQIHVISRLTAPPWLFNRTDYIDGDLLDSTVPNAVPLKVWLYPLKNLHQASACIVKDISEDQLSKAEEVLTKLTMDMNLCRDLMDVVDAPEVFTRFPALKESLAEFCSLLQRHRSNFQRHLASSVKAMRETETEDEEQKLRDLLEGIDRSPFGPQRAHQWLQNKRAQIQALIWCRSANVDILNDQNDLRRFVQDRADRVLCFTFTSLEGEDPVLSALRRNTTPSGGFLIPDTRHKILDALELFLSNKESQETVLIAASVPDVQAPGFAVRLYQSGNLLSRSVRLDLKPGRPEITAVEQTRVTMTLRSLQTQTTERYRVEYGTVREDKRPADPKWSVLNCSEENCVLKGLVPETHYQLRYSVFTHSDVMSDFSEVIDFQTAPRKRPGAPTVLKPNKESLYIAWQRAECDEDSPVLCYKVEYLEAGLDGWQSIQTDGPECECTITLPYSNCYRARVSAVYGNGDLGTPSDETKVPVRVWTVDLSKRKASDFLKAFRRQTTKKSVKLREGTDEESEVLSFLQCLSHISQISIDPPQGPKESLREWRNKVTLFLVKLCLRAAIHQKESIREMFHKLPSCHFRTYREQSAFLLDLYSCVKDYEDQTGEKVRPAFQAVYQTLPEVWAINLSERKTSLFLEVLEFQKVKKAVELRGWLEDETEMRLFLRCLPYISQLRFIPLQPQRECSQERRTRLRRYLLDLCLQAALHRKEMIQAIVEKCFKTDREMSVFLMLLHSKIRDHEIRTGTSVLPALQEVFGSFPKIWSINLSDKQTGTLLEVLQLQTVKRAVELRGLSEDETEIKVFLQCLPFISQLRFGFVLHGRRRKLRVLQFLVKLLAGAAELSAEQGESFTEVLASLCSFRTFSCNVDDQEHDNVARCDLLLELYSHAKGYETETGRSHVLPLLRRVYDSLPDVWTINLSEKKASLHLEVLNFQTAKNVVELSGWSNDKRKVQSFFQCLPRISELRLCSDVLARMAQAKSLRFRPPVILEKLSLADSTAREPDAIRISLAFLLGHWEIQCLDLTEYKMAAESLIGLLNHPGLRTVRFSEDAVQTLVSAVYEAQDERVTRGFLRTVGGDLTSCTLSWEVLHYFLEHQRVTVDFRRSSIQQENIQDLLPLLSKVHLRGLKSSFVLSIMRKLYETSSAHAVSDLLTSTENCINLENRKLNSFDCAALRFTLERCTGISLNLLWTSIPDEELESTVPLLSHASHLRVDRLLLLRLLHVPEFHQEAAGVLSALQHNLDFSCRDALDLTADGGLLLSSDDCRVVSRAIQSARDGVELNIQDCEIEDAGLELLFPVLHKVTLQCSKSVLLRFLNLVHSETEPDRVNRAKSLGRALRDRVDLSETHLNLQACKALALVLEYSEGFSELDLSHCRLTDDALEPMMPHLYKTGVLDLSHNLITDDSARNIYNAVLNYSTQTACLFNNRITDSSFFLPDQRFEI